MKTNTKEISKAIQNILRKIDKTAGFGTDFSQSEEYTLFTFSLMNAEDGKSLYKLEVNIVRKTAKDAEDAADAVQELLDHMNYDSDKLSLYSYISTRDKIEEEDKKIERRRLVFALNYWSKEE